MSDGVFPTRERRRRSEEIGDLALALAAAQGAMKPAAKDARNDHLQSRYADLGSIWEACREALSANGLSVSQFPECSPDGRVSVTTLLMHSSNQWLESELSIHVGEMKGLTPLQVMGLSITYLRRYGLAAVVGVFTDSDNDGDAPASARPAYRAAATVHPARQSPEERQAALAKDAPRVAGSAAAQAVPAASSVQCTHAECGTFVSLTAAQKCRELGMPVLCVLHREDWTRKHNQVPGQVVCPECKETVLPPDFVAQCQSTGAPLMCEACASRE
jgi:hypothetical protein